METLTEEEVWNLERLVEISMLDMAGPQAVACWSDCYDDGNDDGL